VDVIAYTSAVAIMLTTTAFKRPTSNSHLISVLDRR